MQTKQRIPGKVLLANDIEEMLKDPQSLFFKEYNAALMIYADLCALEDEENMEEMLHKLKDERVKWGVHKGEVAEALEREAKGHTQAELDHKHLQTLDLNETNSPELVLQLTELAYHLDEWRFTDEALTEVKAEQEMIIEEWQDIQTDFAEDAITLMTTEHLTLNDGREVPFLLTKQDRKELRTAFNSSITPLQALEKNPHKLDQLRQETKKIIQSLGKDEDTMSLSEIVNVKQASLEKTNINNQAMLNMMIKVIMHLVTSMKKNLSEEEYSRIQWPHPKRNVHRNIEDLLLKNMDINSLKERIRELNNNNIENNLQFQQLSQQRGEHIDNVHRDLEAIYKSLARDPDMIEELGELLDKLHCQEPPFITSSKQAVGQH